MEITTTSPGQTKEVGRKLGDSLIEEGLKRATIALTGDLGAGKTTFIQGLAQAVGVKQRVISPTFIIFRKYKLEDHPHLHFLYHADLYRLDKDVEKDIRNLGLDEIWREEGNIVVVEWAEKAVGLYPQDTVWVEIETGEGDKRKFKITR